MLKAMLMAVTAQINRTPEEETALLAELIYERDRIHDRLDALTVGD